ncbi:MAG: hypothetical protein AAGD92_00735 [Pseudomonadota bacterium]
MFVSGAAIALSLTYAVVFGGSQSTISVGAGGDSISHSVRGDSGEFSLRDDGLSIKAEWRGDFDLDEKGGAIASVDNSLDIEINDNGREERLLLEKDGRDVATRYWLNDEEKTLNPDTQDRISALTLRFLRASGIKAEERVEALVSTSGASSVLEEIDQLTGGHAIRRYAVLLNKNASLSEDQIMTLAEKLQRIDSDHDLSLALQSILERQTVTAETVKPLIAAATKISSDHDKRRLVSVFADTALDETGAGMALDLYETIDSDHDLRVAAESLLENEALNAEYAARLLVIAAERIESDYDLRNVLEASAARITDKNIADAWFAALEKVDSEHEVRIALEEIADRIGDNAELKQRARAVAEAISSDYEREQALEALEEN